MKELLVQFGISIAPEVIAFFRERFAKANPDAPAITDEQVLEALNSAIASGIAKDDEWLAAHPETGDGG